MFVQKNETLDFKLHYKKIGFRYSVLADKEFAALPEEDKVKYKLLNVAMLVMNWGLYNELQEMAMIENSSGERQFNFKVYKEARLKRLIKEWDAKDETGKLIPVNESNIMSLSPDVAESLLRTYDELSFLSDDEEKK